MTIAAICQRNLDTADAAESIQSAAQRMGTRNVGTLIVLSPSGRPAGILTDRDVAVRVAGRGRDPYATRVADVMTTELETITEDVPVEEALSRMRARGVRRLPVVDRQGRCSGIVTMDDVLAHLVREFGVLGRLLSVSSPGVD
ncbi:MAG TPA: CBS domain-containing protein [Planctomycetota bacterium]